MKQGSLKVSFTFHYTLQITNMPCGY